MSQYYRYYVELVEGGTQVKITAYDPSNKTLNEPGGRCDLATVPPDIQRLVDKIRRNTARPAEMDKLGEALFKALFPPGVTTHLRDLLDKVGQKEAILRLELDLNEDDLPAIAALPWEFLRAPETSGRAVDNLGTHPKVVLSRRRALWDVAQPISLDEPLRIQLVVSAPTDEDPVEYEDVFTALQGLAQDHPDQVAPPLEILHQPQLSTLEAALETHRPHILHFIGHGQLRKARGVEFGELALVKPDGRANWRTDEEIGEVFQVFSPLVVFLQACNSGAEGRAGAFVGVASQVVQRNVPVVVAMQYPVSNHVAGIFAKAFYERLSTFTPVDMAVQRGRRLLRQEFKKTRDFATPLIFMRVKDGTLFVPPKPAEPEEETALEPGAALARRFTPIWLEEPAINDAIEIVRAVASGHLAAHHQIGFVPEAIEAAVRLSARYLHDERLPGKAIKLLDEAASSLIVPGTLFGGDEADPVGGGVVTVEDVLEIVAERTNIPVSQLGKTDKQRLLELEERLQSRIIGQNEAIAQVVRVVKRAGAGLSDSRRPQGVFLFAGPTGVGKTELALALTEALFDDESAIFRLDMSEFMEKHQVARLTGAPPGYVGYDDEGQLTGRLRRYPYSVILLDEIEKAHPDVQHLFLQLFDNGRLTDSQGRPADGRQAIFIMTTNLGAKEALGLAAATQSYQQKLQAAIHDHFSMEFINRIDRIAYFNPLDEAALFTIFERELRPFQKKLQQESGVTVTVPDEMKYQIVRHIVQQKLGARPLRRFIEDKVIAPIVDKLLSDDIKPGTQITLGSELEIDNVAPPPVSPLGGQPPPAFDPGQLDLGGVGAPAPPSLQPQRPAKPEDGLPHHDGLPDEEQTEFDECFLALARQLAQKNIALEIERLAKYFLCAPGAADQKPREGRSIKQAFDELIEQPLTDQLLAEEFKDGDRIKLDYSADGPVIKKMEE